MRNSAGEKGYIAPLIVLSCSALLWTSGGTAQPLIVNGDTVSIQEQRMRGLVHIARNQGRLRNRDNYFCSGHLLNGYWVLTARHCITTNGAITTNTTRAPSTLRIEADWDNNLQVVPTEIVDLPTNIPVPTTDLALIYLGASHFQDSSYGDVLGGPLLASDEVLQYGQGYSALAVPGTPPTPATGLGEFRSAHFTASNISNTGYTVALNARNQIGIGGDSGGPSFVIRNGLDTTGSGGSPTAVAGVLSACGNVTYVPSQPQIWRWAMTIGHCNFQPAWPFAADINRITAQRPAVCTPRAKRNCGLSVINYLLN